MAALNRFDFIGRLTKNPEVKQRENGTKIAILNLAQTKKWKDSHGAKQEKSLFFRFQAYGKAAEILEQYAQKGSQLYISATLEPYEKENDDGTKTYGISFSVKDFELLGSRNQNTERPEPELDPEEVFG